MGRHAVLLCFLWALLRPAPTSAAEQLAKTLLPGTRCMDGTPSGYFYTAPPKDTTVWVLWMKGGGGCGNQKTCDHRVQTDPDHCSSKGWSATKKGEGLISDDPTTNPDFAAAHHVYVPYCSSDGHKGTQNTTSSTTWGYYFSGHLNFAAVVRDLIANRGLASATQVLLTGESAGGVGVITNLDYFADQLPGVTVKGAPEAGWFVPGALPADYPNNPYFPPPSYACFTAGRPSSAACVSAVESGEKAITDLYQPYWPPACVAAQPAGEASRCNIAHVLYPFIRTPIYVVENQYDTAQLQESGLPRKQDDAATRAYIAMYGEAMRKSTGQVLANTAKQDGLFLPSCLSHSVNARHHIPKGVAEKIDSQTWETILADWFFGRGQLSKYHQLVDDCTMVDGLPCNAAAGCQLGGGPVPPAPPPAPRPPAPSPAPGPAPPPGPLPAGCQQQLQADGCLAAGSQSACLSCIHQHREDLLAACGDGSMHTVRTQCPDALA